MRRRHPLAWLVFAAVCVGGTLRLLAESPAPAPARAPDGPTAAPAAAPTARSPAQQLAEDFVEDIRQERWDAAFKKMERRFRDDASAPGLRNGLSTMTDFYGTPLAYHYKAAVDGTWQYPSGEVKPLTKVWFATPTKMHATGVFAYVGVVPDGDRLAVSVFTLLSFPEAPPDYLK